MVLKVRTRPQSGLRAVAVRRQAESKPEPEMFISLLSRSTPALLNFHRSPLSFPVFSNFGRDSPAIAIFFPAYKNTDEKQKTKRTALATPGTREESRRLLLSDVLGIMPAVLR